MRESETIALTVTDCLAEIDARLSEAAGLARAGLACAESGREGEAVKIVMNVEELLFEANKLLQMTSLMRRIERKRAPPPG